MSMPPSTDTPTRRKRACSLPESVSSWVNISRPRSQSPDSEKSSLAQRLLLTPQNLLLLRRETGDWEGIGSQEGKEEDTDDDSDDMVPKKDSDSAAVSQAVKLEAGYGLYIDNCETIPKEITDHLQHLLRPQARNESPAAKNLVMNQKLASKLLEADGVNTLVDDLLFYEEWVGGEFAVKYLAKRTDAYLNKAYLPPPYAETAHLYGTLEQAKPDNLLGYILIDHAKAKNSAAPFSRSEERRLFPYALTSTCHFPFFTAEWKSSISSKGHHEARTQGARDGACAVRHMYGFYKACGIEPSIVDTSHISITTDIDTVCLHIHFQTIEDGLPAYHMEPILYAWPRDLEQISKFRLVMRNMEEYAMGTRLDKIREALPSFNNGDIIFDSLRALSAADGPRAKRQKTGGYNSGFGS